MADDAEVAGPRCPPRRSSPRWTTTSTCPPRSRSCTSTCAAGNSALARGDLAECPRRDGGAARHARRAGPRPRRRAVARPRQRRAVRPGARAVVAGRARGPRAGPCRARLRHVRRDPGPPRRRRHRRRGLLDRARAGRWPRAPTGGLRRPRTRTSNAATRELTWPETPSAAGHPQGRAPRRAPARAPAARTAGPRGPGPDAEGRGPRVPPRAQGEGRRRAPRRRGHPRGRPGPASRAGAAAAAPPGPRAAARASTPRDRLRPELGGRGAARRHPRLDRVHRLAPRGRRPHARDHQRRRRLELPAARGQPRRAGPAHGRLGAPGRRHPGAAVRVRATTTTCSTPPRRDGPAGADRRARRRDRPAQPRCGAAVGRGVRRARRAGARAARRRA